MDKNEQQKINELKKIISLGEKLNKDVRPDKKKLEILIDRQNNSTQKENQTNNIEKPLLKKEINEKDDNLNIDTINPIRSISTNGNKIIVKFNKNYVKDDINQTSQKIDNKYVYSFDILGKYKYTAPTKLEIDNIDNISINDKKDSVNIKNSNKENTKITYSLSSKEFLSKLLNSFLNVEDVAYFLKIVSIK